MPPTSGSILVDTNVFVYRVDASEPERQALAALVLQRLDGRVVVSTQVLMEFHAALSRIAGGSPALATRTTTAVRALAAAYPVLPVTPEVVTCALDGIERFRLSTWDAQLWATARIHGVPAILTEDSQGVGDADGIRFVDPFARG